MEPSPIAGDGAAVAVTRRAQSRRTVLGLLGGAAAFAARPSSAVGSPRVVSLSWAVHETLFAMGAAPVGAAELPGYRTVVGTPEPPPGVVDVGLQGSPNLELLCSLAPDLILAQSWQESSVPSLNRCGRVETLTIHTGEGDVYLRACRATDTIGRLLERTREGSELVGHADATMAACRARLARLEGSPIYLAQMIDDAHLSLFTTGSLFQSVLDRIGLANAWTGRPDLLWGGARVGVDALAENPDAIVALIASPGLAPAESLTCSPLWGALPAARGDRVIRLPPVWAFGAVPTAARFATLLVEAIERRISR